MFSALLEMHPQEEELHKLYADVLWIRQKKNDAIAQMQIAVDLAPVRLGILAAINRCYFGSEEI